MWRAVTLDLMTQQMFGPKHQFTADPNIGKCFSAHVIFRGSFSTKEIDDHMLSVRNKNSPNFVEWIPDNVQYSTCEQKPRGLKMGGAYIANSTAIQEVFKRVSQEFNKLYDRKAFLHWYTNEGMEEMEFIEAQSNMNNLISEYKEYQEQQSNRIDENDVTKLD